MTGLPSISVIAHDLGAPEIKDDRCAAWFRGGKNPRSLKLDDEKGAWFDFGQQQGGGIVRLVDIALGVDRLIRLLSGADHIAVVLAFPFPEL